MAPDTMLIFKWTVRFPAAPPQAAPKTDGAETDTGNRQIDGRGDVIILMRYPLLETAKRENRLSVKSWPVDSDEASSPSFVLVFPSSRSRQLCCWLWDKVVMSESERRRRRPAV
jgi:hypothetical protein